MVKTQLKRLEQKGMASILVTMFMMIVITLIVIGFAKLIRREQRQVLDRQLSTQAFYAAESGVNDAVKNLNSNDSAYTKCQEFINAKGLTAKAQLDGTNVEYTCLLVNPALTELKYDTIDYNVSTVVPVKANNTITSLNLSWEQKGGGGTFGSCQPNTASFPAFNSWNAACGAGILRIDLVPTGGLLTQDNLMNSTLTAYLYPVSTGGGSSLVYSAANIGSNSGVITGVNCTTGASPHACNVSITGLGSVGNGKDFYMRIRSVYEQNSLVVTANNGAQALTLSGAQAQVDSTGKASDVLRRISVRVNIAGITGFPDFAIQSADSICKRFYAGNNISPTVDSAYNSVAACALN